jgi:hypothetical protein
MRSLIAAACILTATGALAKSPCDGVDQDLSSDEKESLSISAARQLHAAHATILQSFEYDGWRILRVETGAAREAFLFYRGDRDIAAWDGAGLDEESQIREWAYESADGIPSRLAKCFAWRVARDRGL